MNLLERRRSVAARALLVVLTGFGAVACSHPLGSEGPGRRHRLALLPPRELAPLVRIAFVGGPARLEEPAPLLEQVVELTLAERPLTERPLRVYASRRARRPVWEGRTDGAGRATIRVPAELDGRRLPLRVESDQGRAPTWVRLEFDMSASISRLHWDSTQAVSTAELEKWELASSSTHVYFGWPNRQGAEGLAEVLLEQRRGVEAIYGVPAEPMGAVLLTHPKDVERFITVQNNHTRRSGKFVHGVRSWPLKGGSLEAIHADPAEEKELYITLAHELAENTLIAPDSAGLEHKGTRWFRDGVAECVAIMLAWIHRPDRLAGHVEDRAGNLSAALRSGTKTVDLLDWKQDKNDLTKYACAAAWFVREVRKRPGLLRDVVSRAASENRASSDDLLRFLEQSLRRDVAGELRAVDVAESLETLESVVEDIGLGRPFPLEGRGLTYPGCCPR